MNNILNKIYLQLIHSLITLERNETLNIVLQIIGDYFSKSGKRKICLHLNFKV